MYFGAEEKPRQAAGACLPSSLHSSSLDGVEIFFSPPKSVGVLYVLGWLGVLWHESCVAVHAINGIVNIVHPLFILRSGHTRSVQCMKMVTALFVVRREKPMKSYDLKGKT